MGLIVVPTDETNTIPPFFKYVPAGQTVNLVGVVASLLQGSATLDIQQNGVAIAGLAGITVGTSPGEYPATDTPAVNNYDAFSVLVDDIASTPAGLSVTFLWNYVGVPVT